MIRLLVLLPLCLAMSELRAQTPSPEPDNRHLLVSVTDGKFESLTGRYRVPPSRGPDRLTVYDTRSLPPRELAAIEVAHTVLAPPMSVALHPTRPLALVSAAVRVEPAPDPATEQLFRLGPVTVRVLPGAERIVPESVMQVVDLDRRAVTQRLVLPSMPLGVTINRQGTLALAAHADGIVSVLALEPEGVRLVEALRIGGENAFLGATAFTPDGRFALVSKRGEHSVAVLAVEGTRVTATGRELTTGNSPYAIDIGADGRFAAVANIGRNTGDADTVSIIDLTREPFRVSDTLSVGQTPESLAISPDSRLLAVSIQNGASRPTDNPFRGDGGRLLLFGRDGAGAWRVRGAVRTGTNTQGVAFLPDGQHVVVQNYVERELAIFRIGSDGAPTDTGQRVATVGWPAAIRLAPVTR